MKQKILIADDDGSVREALKLILGESYELVLVENGEEALSKLKQQQFDLILLDIKMPKLDGLEVLKRIKSDGIKSPVLVLTAYQSVEFAKEAVKLGASNYLP